MEFLKEREVLAKHIYLSLGNKEEKTKNAVMSRVGDCIRSQYELLEERGADCILEWNSGGHFKDTRQRSAAAFLWCMSKIKEQSL